MLVNPCNLGERFENSEMGLFYTGIDGECLYKAEDLDFQRIKKVFYYKSDYLFLTQDDELYYGNEKVKALEGKKIVDVSICPILESVLFLEKNGRVYSWGKNGNGQLGLGDTEDRDVPELIEGLNEEIIVQVKMGWKFSLALTKSGKVYSWGWNNSGQLGHGDIVEKHIPEQIKALDGEKIVQIGVGYFYCFALSESGRVYSWGSNKNGILGHGFEDAKSHTTPCIASHLRGLNIVQIASGPYHSLALTKEGSVLSWGANWVGQLGHGHMENVTKPQTIDYFKDKKVVKIIGTMGHHSIAITDDERLYSWGLNDFAQLGFYDKNDRIAPEYVGIKPENL